MNERNSTNLLLLSESRRLVKGGRELFRKYAFASRALKDASHPLRYGGRVLMDT